MAAGLGFKNFVTGDILTAADANGYLQSQTVMVFADAAARTAAITSPQEGMISYLKDTNATQYYSGSAWVAVGGSSPLTTKGDLYTYSTADARLGVGTNGQVLLADSTAATGLKWGAPVVSSGLTLVSRTAFSSVSSQIFDSVFTSTYANYAVVIDTIYGSDGSQALQMQLRYGTTTAAASYQGGRVNVTNGGTVTGGGVDNQSVMTLAPTVGSSGEPTVGSINFYRVGNSAQRANFDGTIVNMTYSANPGFVTFGGTYNDAANTITGFLLKAASGNITGTVSIYGLAKA